jgi:lysophospholipase L1-like esterase
MPVLRYAALGDSTGVGVGARDGRSYVHRIFTRLQQLDPGARLLNASTSGATSATVVDTQLHRVTASPPTLATLFVGGNDVWRGVPASRFARHIDHIVRALASTGATVLVGTVPNLAHAPAVAFAEAALGLSRAVIADRIVAYNAGIVAAAERHGAQVVDLYGFELADAPHFFSVDGFHPSSEGYAAWEVLLWPAIERALAPKPSKSA